MQGGSKMPLFQRSQLLDSGLCDLIAAKRMQAPIYLKKAASACDLRRNGHATLS